MKLSTPILTLIGALLVGQATAAPSDRNLQVTAPAPSDGIVRVALVIGNNAYKNFSRLDNPTHDAQMIGNTLKGLGFELVGGKPQTDLDKRAMDQALAEFGKRLSRAGGAVGLLYYAGHGVQVNGNNYLIPTDANPTKPSDLNSQTLNAEDILQVMQDAGQGNRAIWRLTGRTATVPAFEHEHAPT